MNSRQNTQYFYMNEQINERCIVDFLKLFCYFPIVYTKSKNNEAKVDQIDPQSFLTW